MGPNEANRVQAACDNQEEMGFSYTLYGNKNYEFRMTIRRKFVVSVQSAHLAGWQDWNSAIIQGKMTL